MTVEHHRVVVGVSTGDCRSLVGWAAGEARARHAELRLVTAAPDRALPDTHLLADLTDEVAAGWPGLTVATDVVAGPPAVVLRAAGEEADLLVVGADDASPFVEAIRGSVPGDLLTTSPCPLAVVPRRERLTPASAPVVVALDESATTQAAFAYGYVTAARSGRPLTILRCVGTGRFGATAATAQARLLIAYGELYPDVTVSTDVVADDPRHVLVAASRRAALLVLGSRGRLISSLFGSVSRDLIRRSHCPVVVARIRTTVVALCS